MNSCKKKETHLFFFSCTRLYFMLNFDRNQHGWLRSPTVTACDIFTESVIKLFNINTRKECGSIFYFNIIQRCILTSTLGLPIIFTQPLFILFYFFSKRSLIYFRGKFSKKKINLCSFRIAEQTWYRFFSESLQKRD